MVFSGQLFGSFEYTFGQFWVLKNTILYLYLDPLCPPILSGHLVCAFAIQNFESLLQKLNLVIAT